METKTYEVKIRLSTEKGECPTEYELERLVADQMSGILDEAGLKTIAVFDPEIVQEVTFAENNRNEGDPLGAAIAKRLYPGDRENAACSWCNESATYRDEEGYGYAVCDYYCDTHLEVWGVGRQVVAL